MKAAPSASARAAIVTANDASPAPIVSTIGPGMVEMGCVMDSVPATIDAPSRRRSSAVAEVESSSVAPVTVATTPGEATTRPSNDNSPTAIQSPSCSASVTPIAASNASAIGRSKWLPSLGRSAGLRLIVIRLLGRAMAIAPSAARTLSRASDTALSGRPTIEKAGIPAESAHCTSTMRASMPWNATVYARATILPLMSCDTSGVGRGCLISVNGRGKRGI